MQKDQNHKELRVQVQGVRTAVENRIKEIGRKCDTEINKQIGSDEDVKMRSAAKVLMTKIRTLILEIKARITNTKKQTLLGKKTCRINI